MKLFTIWFNQFKLPPKDMGVPDALPGYQHLLLFNFIFSRGCTVVPYWHCHLHFSDEAENVLMGLLGILSLFYDMSAQIFCSCVI